MKKFHISSTWIIGLVAAIIILIVTVGHAREIVPLVSTPPAKPTPTTTLFLAGDIMLSRNVAGKIYAANDVNLPFEKTQTITSAADIAFANLESPFNNTGSHDTQNSLVFNADPNFASGLNYAGFDVLSTANNHAYDQGNTGIDQTLQILKNHGIIPVGTYPTTSTKNLSQNIITKNNTKFGFLSYSYTAHNDGGKSVSPYIADFNDLSQLKADIQTLKADGAQIVIVNMHAGIEYTREPTAAQVNFAHAAIDDGADIVVGEHPHWVQPTENYKGKWIFYGLGNFVFDQMWSTETRQGLTVEISFDKTQITKIELKPVIIDDYSTPRFANSDESAAILKTIDLTNPMLFVQN